MGATGRRQALPGSRGRIRTGVTRFGAKALVFYVLMIAAYVAAPYTNLSFLLLSFLTILAVGDVHASRRNLRGVAVAGGELGSVPSGTEAELALDLEAQGRARFGLAACVELEGPDGVVLLRGRRGVLDGRDRVDLRSPALARGLYPVRRAFLETTHPLGLVRSRRALELSGDAGVELVVYPAPHSVLEGRSAAAALDELLGLDAQAGALQPESLRDHREGEELRRVHWRASARRGSLVVQEWEGGHGQGLEVVLDRRCEADGGEELEGALATLSAMVRFARSGKETLRVHSQGLTATYGEGHEPWSAALRFLATADALPADGPAPPPVSPAVARLPRELTRA